MKAVPQEDKERQPSSSVDVATGLSTHSNMTRMPDPDAHGIIHGCCGDTMEIFLRLDGDRIEEATFATDGHESAISCAGRLTQMARGLTLENAYEIKPEDVIAALGGLPEAKIHCAHLAVNTLRQAIDNQHVGGGETPDAR